MKKIKENKKGLTLIEIVVTMTILFIVLGTVFPLFNSNYKALTETEVKNDLQREGQEAMKYISDKAMEAQNIVLLKDENDKTIVSKAQGRSLDDVKANIKEIEFMTDSTENTSSGKNGNISYKFYMEKQRDNLYQLKYKREVLDSNGNAVQTENERIIANNIESIEVAIIDKQVKKFDECKGLNIKINLKKRGLGHSLNSQVFFRNGGETLSKYRIVKRINS